jgi:hypothetical protein
VRPDGFWCFRGPEKTEKDFGGFLCILVLSGGIWWVLVGSGVQ